MATGYALKTSRDPHGETYLFRHTWTSPAPGTPVNSYPQFRTDTRTAWHDVTIDVSDAVTDVGWSIGPDGVVWMLIYDSANDSYRSARSFDDGQTWIEDE